MKTQAHIKELLFQHRALTEKAVKCFEHANLTKAEENWQKVYKIERQIIDAFAEKDAKCSHIR